MFTQNNFVFVTDKSAKENKQLKLTNTKNSIDALSVQLPLGNVAFMTSANIEKSEPEKKTVAQLVFENNKGQQYNIEVDPNDVYIFTKFSKLASLENLITKESNFAAMDWMGLPCKLISVNYKEYEGPFYKFTTNDTCCLVISGIVFVTKDNLSEIEAS